MATSSSRTPARDEREMSITRWRRYLADERAEAAVYRELAERKTGQEREILLGLAEAEGRHESHWLALLGDDVGKPLKGDIRTRMLAFLARHFGSLFVLALAQRAEARSPYDDDTDASESMAADERIHGEVLRGLAARGRTRLAGSFRAAVFGANDGLVSNLALVLGIETKSLLLGEGASPENVATIRDAINANPTVESLIHMKTLYLGPDELMVAAKVAFPPSTRLVEIAVAIDALEADIRSKIPAARVIYIEPDLYHPPAEGNPSTDAIILKSED